MTRVTEKRACTGSPQLLCAKVVWFDVVYAIPLQHNTLKSVSKVRGYTSGVSGHPSWLAGGVSGVADSGFRCGQSLLTFLLLLPRTR